MAYLPLSTANLPDPVIDPAQGASPEDHFNPVLWTGDGTSPRNITSVGFEPSLVWWKTRNQPYDHRLYDQVRGTGKRIGSNSTAAESTTTELTAFNSDGFTLGNGAASAGNGSGESMVAWNWKANGSGVTNTDGSITSTVSANTTSGFSIATYSGTGANATVGHGLNSAPEVVICKSRDFSESWAVYHKDVGNTKQLILESTTAPYGPSSTYWNNTSPTSSVVSLGSDGKANGSGHDYVMYCFHSVEGFSKFGSYVGNGSADGPFVYTGFRPAFVITKKTSGTSNWQLLDAARTPINDGGRELLRSNTSDAEISDGNEVDFLSNGFKQRSSDGSVNQSGATYIYMAFAENPFKYSNAR